MFASGVGLFLQVEGVGIPAKLCPIGSRCPSLFHWLRLSDVTTHSSGGESFLSVSSSTAVRAIGTRTIVTEPTTHHCSLCVPICRSLVSLMSGSTRDTQLRSLLGLHTKTSRILRLSAADGDQVGLFYGRPDCSTVLHCPRRGCAHD